jgi:aspartate/methionine/tyrosine aminotransferase
MMLFDPEHAVESRGHSSHTPGTGRKSPILSNEIRKRLMNEHGVVVVHGAAYGPGGEGTLRVSFASGGDTLTRGLDRLSEGLTRIMESTR